ncbi:hypothetical protein BDU57DRAFT_536563 [Ampelomyces quisqualis]|uniref:Uncharacterized protein n=1 Tax=Ampelomyces quisqualis TaxID=50730 RepID=A0A6A5QW65_AMPQU|nr:hypothetical protein BDU57DRAFT_536563 [Ampelomyces quisqualis]
MQSYPSHLETSPATPPLAPPPSHRHVAWPHKSRHDSAGPAQVDMYGAASIRLPYSPAPSCANIPLPYSPCPTPVRVPAWPPASTFPLPLPSQTVESGRKTPDRKYVGPDIGRWGVDWACMAASDDEDDEEGEGIRETEQKVREKRDRKRERVVVSRQSGDARVDAPCPRNRDDDDDSQGDSVRVDEREEDARYSGPRRGRKKGWTRRFGTKGNRVRWMVRGARIGLRFVGYVGCMAHDVEGEREWRQKWF